MKNFTNLFLLVFLFQICLVGCGEVRNSNEIPVDIEIETANRMGNKRPAEETKGESGIRPKSPRFDDVVSPATITDSLEIKANIDFWFETNESKTNPGLNNNYFMTTTTANAGKVMGWVEELLQTRWNNLLP